MKNLLKENLKKHISVSDAELEKFCLFFEEKNVKKKALLLKQGEICSGEFFVVGGLLRLFHTNHLGEEQTLQFGEKNWWFADLDSLFNRTPSRLSIQAIEESQILFLPFEKRKIAQKELPFLDELFGKMLLKSYTAMQNRLIDNLSKTADERYLDYVHRYPSIVKRLSNIEMASYLGVSPASLSRIKTQILENNKKYSHL